jgi:hypothetical protein
MLCQTFEPYYYGVNCAAVLTCLKTGCLFAVVDSVASKRWTTSTLVTLQHTHTTTTTLPHTTYTTTTPDTTEA